MDISLSLVELLRLHDCVIIPDLGGFIANYRPAEMDLASNKFFPPKKEIVFSSKLNKNDGLLVSHICETEGLGYFEARKVVSEYTDEAWSKLENGEILEFPSIGSLRFDKNDKLIFEPAVLENLLLDTFGMEDFHFSELTRIEPLPVKQVFRDKEAVRPVFASRKVKRVLLAIPVVLALALIPVARMTMNDGNLMNPQTSAAASLPIDESAPVIAPTLSDLDENTPAEIGNTITHENALTGTAIPATSEMAAPANKTEETPVQSQVVNTAPSKGKYHLIGGCFKSRENADKLVALMAQKGFQPEIETLKSGAFRVTIQSYSDRKEAMLALDSLQEAEPQAGYWMMVN